MKKAVLHTFVAAMMVCAVDTSQAQNRAQTPTTDPGVNIGGVVWATRNVNREGRFVDRPEGWGGYFNFDEAQTACPEGWRMPTREELEVLMSVSNQWALLRFVPGRFFVADDENRIFLPAAGFRGWDGRTGYRERLGAYASSTPVDTSGYENSSLFFNDITVGHSVADASLSLRCVRGSSARLVGREEAGGLYLDGLASYYRALRNFSNNIPREKVYIHFDNTSYYRGDDIWFKCYVVAPGDNTLGAVSKTLYVELLNPGGEVVDKRILRVAEGEAHGDFRLSHTPFYSGFYEVRAYTKPMLNYGDQTIFSRLLPVYDQPRQQGDYAEKSMTNYNVIAADYPNKRTSPTRGRAVNVRFFPEGGSLVAGVSSRVAFEATDNVGQPVDVTGSVDGVAFSSTHGGRGLFTHTPDTGPGREVEVEHEGRRFRFTLPGALPQGVAMEVDNLSDADSVAITLRKSPLTPEQTFGVAFLSGGRLRNFIFAHMTGERLDFKAPRSRLASGVSQIVLFDDAGQPLADRLVFTPPVESIAITARTDKPFYAPFEQIEMEFSARHGESMARGLGFSVAVRDGAGQVDHRSDIMADLLLMSEIKGYVHDPLYYFEGDDPARRSALDNLLMVQGWRRYRWEHLTGLEPPDRQYPVEEAILTRGRVVRTSARGRETPREGVNVSLVLAEERAASGEAVEAGQTGQESAPGVAIELLTTDARGRFSFETDIEGRWNMILGAADASPRDRIMLERLFSPPPRGYEFSDLRVDIASEGGGNGWLVAGNGEEAGDGTSGQTYEQYAKAYIDSMAGVALEDRINLVDVVTVRARRNREADIRQSRSSSVAYYDVAAEFDDLVDSGDSRTNDINTMLAKTNENFRITPDGRLLYKNKPTFVVIDYKPIRIIEPDMSVYKSLNVEAIKAIYVNDQLDAMARYIVPEIMESGMMIALKMGCVVLVETYPDSEIPAPSGAGTRKTYLEGYTPVRDFSFPDYSRLPPMPDYRRTLYWNPSLKTDENGTATVTFYNNGTARRQFSVSAETATPSGMIGVYR